MSTKKINITIQEDVLQRVDDFAKHNGMSRSSLLQLGASQYIQAQEAMPSINNVFALLGSLAKRAASGGVDSAEYEQELAQLEACQKKLMPKG